MVIQYLETCHVLVSPLKSDFATILKKENEFMLKKQYIYIYKVPIIRNLSFSDCYRRLMYAKAE